MEIKSFEAYSMRDALKAVKNAFGPDAVILKTREKPGQPNQGGRLIEITATAASSTRAIGATSNASDATVPFTEIRLQAIEDSLYSLCDRVALKSQFEDLEAGLQEMKLLLLETLRGKSGSAIEGLPAAMVNVERQLRVMGVDDVYIASLVKHLKNLPPSDDFERKLPDEMEQHYRDQSIRWMMQRIKIAPKWSALPGSTSIHAFLGTTGVGKTSTVAKLAAHYHAKEKSKVLVVSFDNQRLAASEQLRVYAKVIGVSFATINDLSELPKLIEKHKEVDLVLIDTAGRSPKSSSHLQELELLRSSELPIENHLVLSISEKDHQLDRTVRYFSKLGIHSLIFSKLDQTWSYGEIFNLSCKWHIPLSYFSTGPSIPEDLERSSRERVVERIFGI